MKAKSYAYKLTFLSATITLMMVVAHFLAAPAYAAKSCPKVPFQFSGQATGPPFLSFPIMQISDDIAGPPEDTLYVIEYVSASMEVQVGDVTGEEEVLQFRIATSVNGGTPVLHYIPVFRQGLKVTPIGLPGAQFTVFVAGQEVRLYATGPSLITVTAIKSTPADVFFVMDASISGYSIDLSNRNCTGVGLGQ